ncbi:PREDICTED: ATP-dependent RNA helicase SUPV3L1, mitochondrial-like [Rhagoletis zephyria]|uniref:ATP-dependent RNA helicase SUPV3L1, mitochondrial-like n=1 Tax=Rhagoletis zephyria TaxID=28612 RepID=UPI00081148AF|nr:PREDICTED: ATP-dependent RNA helicase SUPV3L1, mitochondrial-like [Rhagoletis zephyria]
MLSLRSLLLLGRRRVPFSAVLLQNSLRACSSSKSSSRDIEALLASTRTSPNSSSNSSSSSAADEWGDIGEELTGKKLSKEQLIPVLNKFLQRQSIRQLAAEHGLKPKLLIEAFSSYRRKILEAKVLDPEIHILLSDIVHAKGHVDDLFPSFLKHAKQIYPHIDCLDDLKKISDLRLPPNWYPQARTLTRRFVFHCGPTNSGKTHQALERFISAKSAIYCGPLKMLAVEVYQKANAAGVPCDLITGEERRYASVSNIGATGTSSSSNPISTSTITPTASSHVACTVEMSSVNQRYEVAVIDEIQMVRDAERGWAWTRALLGIAADEVHLCGEKAALSLVVELLATTGETVEVHEYNRLTKLTVEEAALETLEAVRPGDCIVCFSKRDIYAVSLRLERMGFNVATIYGTLPPATKLLQSSKFNDPADPCNVLVATDAIGMGLNLSIRRIVFYSLVKPTFNRQQEKTLDVIPVSQALQIAGRAGRYRTQYAEAGYVTTFRAEDLPILREVLASPVEEIEAAGLHPTLDQIELFSFLLPNATLSSLLDIFISLSQLNPHYFMCNIESIKFLAGILEHIPLPLRARYVFCCAPVDNKSNFVCAMFLKYARQFANAQPMTVHWLCAALKFPFRRPANMAELDHLLSVYDCFDLYLWLSYRFPDVFLDQELVRGVQRKLDEVILEGVMNITKLLRASGTGGGGASVGGPYTRGGGGGGAHSPSARSKQISMLISNSESDMNASSSTPRRDNSNSSNNSTSTTSNYEVPYVKKLNGN